MDPWLQIILDRILQENSLAEPEKESYAKSIKEIDKTQNQVQFRLATLEEDRHTLSVMLEECAEDLQKKSKTIEEINAELKSKNRELEIESSLEQVRAVALGMKKPEDMPEVCKIIAHQLEFLNVKEIRNVQTAIFYENKGTYINYEFYLKYEKISITEVYYKDHQIAEAFASQMIKGANQVWMQGFKDEEIREWLNYQKSTNVFIDAYLETAKTLNYYWYSLGPVAMGISTYAPLNEDEINLFKRFKNVFELAYRRYLDIETAQAQAREAQIEAALEKVRSRSVGMHHSDELEQVVASLFDQFVELGFSLDGALICLFDKEKRSIQHWIATTHLSAPVKIDLPYDEEMKDNVIIKDLWNAIKTGKHIFNKSYSGKIKNDYFRYVAKCNESKIPESVQSLQIKRDSWTAYLVAEKNSLIGFDSWSGPIAADEYFPILIRFARVFEQAYTRFLDLQKAEAQAREAQIEATLEKIRSASLAMRRSDEIVNIVAILFDKSKELGLVFDGGIAVMLFSEDSGNATIGVISPELNVPVFHDLPYDEEAFANNPIALDQWRGKDLGLDIVNKFYTFEQKNRYFEYVFKHNDETKLPKPLRDFILNTKSYTSTFIAGKNLLVGANSWTEQVFSEENIATFRRIARVFEQAYIHFLDLQKAEALARETVKQAALDRIRADIASMRTTKDLERITPLIWNELNILGVPFIRCGIFLMDDSQSLIHTFLSAPDGKAIAAFNIPYDTPGNIKEVLRSWHNKKNYIDYWDEKEFIEFAGIIAKQGALVSPEQYLQTIPHGGFHLHFSPFLQGMLYVANTFRLGEEEIQLIQSMADAFSTAYARYEDFNKLEAAKQQVDKTLTELKQAQAQLVQSEKMASLGELTAGIAHEIQNPLNFVNNFSEVNAELLREMRSEIEKGNLSEVRTIADVIFGNEEKIIHHGKRADSIVKGMLQHSRSSARQKEPADINVLADEYLRLSYHGLRAKDSSFHVTMKTDFDRSIGKINIVPQDIGRVLLNMFNNAFYAVSEKKKSGSPTPAGGAGYEPCVTVSTKLLPPTGRPTETEIRISDNGNGIPQKVLDKIFQPFFTTKPAGQGTGLGLSLSYDIIKAHGGEIKVGTKENEGSEFIIQLPFQ